MHIQNIIDHKVDTEGKYTFLYSFSDGTRNWVPDVPYDIKDELALDNYLHSKGICTVYLYCRVSTKHQFENGLSLETQEYDLVNAAKNRYPKYRHKVLKVQSSVYKNIPLEIYNLTMRSNMGNIIMTYRVDRLSRNISKAVPWLESLKHIEVISLFENINYRDNRLKFYECILEAQTESEKLGSRIRNTLKVHRERGEPVGCLEYGKMYFRGADGVKIVQDNVQEMSVINEIMASTNPPSKIAFDLNSRGINKKGKKWTVDMVRKIRYKKERKERKE